MPIYEYRCTECEQVTEAMQKVGARPLRRCTACGGKLEKLISRTSFHLKGGGWYAQGYGSGKSGKDSGKDSGESSSAEGGSGTGEAKKKEKKKKGGDSGGSAGPKAAMG